MKYSSKSYTLPAAAALAAEASLDDAANPRARPARATADSGSIEHLASVLHARALAHPHALATADAATPRSLAPIAHAADFFELDAVDAKTRARRREDARNMARARTCRRPREV